MRLKKYLNESKISSSDMTNFYETAAMIGVISGQSDNINKLKKLAGSGNYDWNKKGVSLINNIEENDNMKNDFINIVKGMNIFMQNVGYKIVGNKPHFIHNQINKYYKKEIKVMGAIEGSKSNTSDAIISSHSVEETFKALDTGKIKVVNDHIVLNGKVKIIQVSLKKGKKEAQIGKITKMISHLGYGSDIKKATSQFSENINEGILDSIKRTSFKTWKLLSNALNSFIKSITDKWTKILTSKKEPLQYVSKLMKDLEIAGLTEKSITNETEKIVNKIAKNPYILIKTINDYINKLDGYCKDNPIIYNDFSLIKPYKSISNDINKSVFTLISNYLTVLALIDMVNDTKGISKIIQRLVAEMIFGGTKLPLYKVYGYYGNDKPYEYLGTIETSEFKNTDEKIEVMGIKIVPQKNKYYTIYILMLKNIDDEGKKYYIKLRTGTNSSSEFSFIFEGSSIKGPYDIDRPISQII